ncbi:hypothetical protein E1B28_010308 [Marasmius oreades]|uniref:Uncharacterized protein n=1 Tax=Marasmius oreades TaxID=181124 RepID=A0A9P7RWZ2_9AGAR|nr:uncharacterized protein E1B28_010308 [Marasmius oreades]KAG7091259.1 hypothetical protein E1B28_010308 [Marasmius oreades]
MSFTTPVITTCTIYSPGRKAQIKFIIQWADKISPVHQDTPISGSPVFVMRNLTDSPMTMLHFKTLTVVFTLQVPTTTLVLLTFLAQGFFTSNFYQNSDQ